MKAAHRVSMAASAAQGAAYSVLHHSLGIDLLARCIQLLAATLGCCATVVEAVQRVARLDDMAAMRQAIE
jgi:hypothetical protein